MLTSLHTEHKWITSNSFSKIPDVNLLKKYNAVYPRIYILF